MCPSGEEEEDEAGEEEEEEYGRADDGLGGGEEGEPLNAAADFLGSGLPSSWAPPDFMQLSKNELVGRVCELERDLLKMWEEFVDAENDHRFAVETV